MDYQVQLNSGQIIKLSNVVDFNPDDFVKTLNDRQIQFINIGGAIINKNIILSMTPVQQEVKL